MNQAPAEFSIVFECVLEYVHKFSTKKLMQ